ncbi:MAG TPA: HAD family phosphatase [Acidisarcina sp.]|nr:HAD family phosphatase [Acidisarcina sp.]
MDLRAVVFDYGMVLSAPLDPQARRGMIATTGLSPEVFDHYYWSNRHDFDRGALDGQAYWQKIARDTDIRLSEEQVNHLLTLDAYGWMSLNEPALAWAQQVQAAGMKTGILSNIGDTQVVEMKRQFGWLKDFNHCTWSYELKMAKPEPEIYRYTVAKLGVAPEQALFLDDRAENIRGAESVGMCGFVFRNMQQLVEDLKAHGLDRLLPIPLALDPQAV